jgi:hypothetical protein
MASQGLPSLKPNDLEPSFAVQIMKRNNRAYFYDGILFLNNPAF